MLAVEAVVVLICGLFIDRTRGTLLEGLEGNELVSSLPCSSDGHCPSLLSPNASSFPSLTLDDCSLALPSPLPRFSASSLSFTCAIEVVPYFFLSSFRNLRSLVISNCTITRLPWQAMALSTLDELDVTSCPLICSCDHLWFSDHRGLNIFGLPHKVLSNVSGCNLSCPRVNLSYPEEIVTTQGAPLSLRVNIVPPQNSNISAPGPFFMVQSGKEYSVLGAEEEVGDGWMALTVPALDQHHLGYFLARCWFCSQPVSATTKVAFPLPFTVLIPNNSDSHILHIRGYPLENLTLTVSEDGTNISETHSLGSNDFRIFNDSLRFRPLEGHWLFPTRSYGVYTYSCTFCHWDHPNGNFTFLVCDDTGYCSNATASIDHLSSPTADHPFPSMSLSPQRIIVLLFVLFFFCGVGLCSAFAYLLSRKAKNESAIRRASGYTEETRLEERTSLSSGYSHHIIPTISLGNIQVQEKIGQGAFGEVYRGIWLSNGEVPVAVKTIRDANEKEEKEATLLVRLEHDNIVRLYGTSRDGDRLLLIFEMMNLGDLRSYVTERRPRLGQYTQFPPALLGKELVLMVKQIVTGLSYLADMGIVHRDIAARNCLVSGPDDHDICIASNRKPVVVKISDFGMSRRLYSQGEYYRIHSTSSVLPVRWLPPESLNTGIFNQYTDIWALGVTIWEIFSYGLIPFADLSTQELLAVCLAGHRPPKPPGCPDEMFDLMKKCWEMDPTMRITAKEALLHPALLECDSSTNTSGFVDSPPRFADSRADSALLDSSIPSQLESPLIPESLCDSVAFHVSGANVTLPLPC